MDRILSLRDLEEVRKKALELEAATTADCPIQIRVSLGSCGIAAGANDTLEAIEWFISINGLMGVQTRVIGCLGMCALEPIVQVVEADLPPLRVGEGRGRARRGAHDGGEGDAPPRGAPVARVGEQIEPEPEDEDGGGEERAATVHHGVHRWRAREKSAVRGAPMVTCRCGTSEGAALCEKLDA
jgi:NADP-reducing hydrogenase subunit HndB